MDFEVIGAELRRVRLEQGKSVTLVADEMYTSATQIWRLERGMKGSGIRNIEILEEWCRYYGIDLVELVKIGMDEKV